MTVKEFKDYLEKMEDNSEIIFKSESGIEWEILSKDLLLTPEKFKNKPKIFVTVK